MKKFFLLMVFIAITFAVKAQDVIVLRNTTEIQAKVETIGQNEITYRKWSNLEGPIYTMAKSEIFFIKYENGDKDTFGEYESSLASSDKKQKYLNQNFKDIHTWALILVLDLVDPLLILVLVLV